MNRPILRAAATTAFGLRLRWLWILAVLAAMLPGGCQCNPEFAEVEGVVTLDGKALDGVQIVFLPDPGKCTKGPRSSAYTNEQGKFKLFCDKANRAGAVIGSHRVCVTDIAAVTTPANLPGMQAGTLLKSGPGQAKGKAARVPPIYNNPAQTPLHATVIAGRQSLDFDIRISVRK